MPEDIPVADRVKKSFSALSSVASTLNASSDKLSSNIATLEAELKKLSLGVSSSVISDDRDPHGMPHYDFDRLLYSKINGKWGFAIECATGDERADTWDSHEIWPFNEAPRGKRVRAVDSIPALLDKLAKDAAKMVEEVDERCETVARITEAITSPTTPEPTFARKLQEALTPQPRVSDESPLLDLPTGEPTVKARDLVIPNDVPQLPIRPGGGKRK
jgi:hypothetical protein